MPFATSAASLIRMPRSVDAANCTAIAPVLAHLPLEGRPISLRVRPELRVSRGKLRFGRAPGSEVHAASFLRRRLMILDSALLASPREFRRILVHELFHFVWLRLGNATRRSWEHVLAQELRRRARGELGWSAELRKRSLAARDASLRTRRWREYCCESFCDTAAFLFAGVRRHNEFTLAARHCERRRRWFGERVGRPLSV